MKEKKIQVITVSHRFMIAHPRAGEPTYFAKKIMNGVFKTGYHASSEEYSSVIIPAKIHTIRDNRELWLRVAERIISGEMLLSIRQWLGRPYHTNQETICNLEKMGVQEVVLRRSADGIEAIVEGRQVDIDTLANNDGLSRADFEAWFVPALTRGRVFEGVVIHFTDFRY